MDVGFHQIADGGKYQSMPSQRQLSFEGIADDVDIKMTSAITCTGMSGVTMALIDNFQTRRFQCSFNRQPDFFDSITHGNTNLNGLTSTLA